MDSLKRRPRNTKAKGQCLFCSGSVTKEHIFAQWVDDALPPSPSDVTYKASYTPFTLPNQKSTKITTNKQGDVTVIFVRKACKSCNEGWMRLLDEAASEFFPAMMSGLEQTLTVEQMISLARWASLKSALIDAKTPEFTSVSRSDCEEMKEYQMPPKSWVIWLGRCPTKIRQVGTEHRCRKYFRPDGVMERAQSTTIRLGELVLFCACSPDPNMIEALRLANRSRALTEIWPKSPTGTMIWPTSVNRMSEEAFWRLCDVIGNL